jgi:hypothetical protein
MIIRSHEPMNEKMFLKIVNDSTIILQAMAEQL